MRQPQSVQFTVKDTLLLGASRAAIPGTVLVRAMLKQLLHFIFGPHTFEVVAFSFAAFGVAFALASEKDDVVKAQYFFAMAALLSLGRVVHLLLTWKTDSLAGKYLVAFVLFGGVAVGWLAAYDWVQKKLDHISIVKEVPATLPSPLPKQSDKEIIEQHETTVKAKARGNSPSPSVPEGGTKQERQRPSQTMVNSPGGIQAGGDVVIAAERRLIHSMQLRISIETETAVAQITEPQTDIGLISFMALFADKTRIRFQSDGRVVDHQFAPTQRRLSFLYEPETPEEVNGQDIEYLAAIDTMAVNYKDIFATEHFDTNNSHTILICEVIVNGIRVATIRDDVTPPGYLDIGQMIQKVQNVFVDVPNVYAKAVSAQR